MELSPEPASAPRREPALRAPINILDGMLAVGARSQREGRLPDAEHIYRQILSLDPRHAAAHYRLGTLAHQVGKLDAAAQFVGAALGIAPQVALYHARLGAILQEQGRTHEAAACFQHALNLEPVLAEMQMRIEALRLNRPSTPAKGLEIA